METERAFIHYKILDSFLLNSPENISYVPFILPTAAFSYAPPKIDASFLAITAHKEEHMVGLLLVLIHPDSSISPSHADLYSWFVAESHRNQGIGQALLKILQEHLVKEKCSILSFLYDTSSSFAPVIENILQSQKWNPPCLFLVRCYFDANFNSQWYQDLIRNPFPSEVEMFLWQNVTREERMQIVYEASQHTFLPYLSPFHKEDHIEHSYSLGLRYRGKVIGWCITHRVLPDLLCYSILYIEKEFHLLGYGIKLLAHTIQLYIDNPCATEAFFEVNLQQIDHTWWYFIRKRLIPYTTYTSRIKQARRFFRQR